MENKSSFSHKIISFLNIVLRVVIIALIVILLHSIYKGLKQDGYIIQAIQTPKSFTDSGFNGVVVANKLQDKIKRIKANANSARQDSLIISANNSSDLKMDVMGIGVSSTSLIFHLRDLLNIETKTIRGDLTDLDKKLSLTIRVHNFPVNVVTVPYDDGNRSKAFDEVMTKAAEYVLTCTDPYYQVVNLYHNSRYDEAHDLIREMINNRPGEAKWAYLAWGNMMGAKGDLEKSKEYHLKSIELDEDFYLPNKNIAWKLLADGEQEKAITHFENALKTRPNDYESINGIAMSYKALKDTARAESYYKLNVDRNPSVVWAYMTYADFYTSVKKDTQTAINIFNKAKSQVTQNDDYYLTQAGYYFYQSKIDSAFIYLDKSLDFNPNNVSALYQIIGYLVSPEINNYKKAIPFQKRLVKISKDSKFNKGQQINAINGLAISEWNVGELDSAYVHIQQAINLVPFAPLPYTTLAEIHFAKNNRREFYNTMQKAFDLGLKFDDSWLEDEPYKTLKTDSRFVSMLEKYKNN